MVRHLRQRLTRFLTALVILTVIVFGLPALFVYCTRMIVHSSSPIPTHVSIDGARSWVGHHLATSEIVTVLARTLLTIGWVMWAVLVAKILTAFVRALSAARPEPGPARRTGTAARAIARPTVQTRGAVPAAVTGGRLDGFARWLVTGFTVATISLPAFPTNAAAGTRTDAVATLVHAPNSDRHPDTGRPTTAADPRVDVGGSMVRVEAGETAETFAARTLGHPERWQELWDLNHHQIVDPASGTRWTEPWTLRAGWVLQLPTTSVDVPATVPDEEVVVEAGDTLWGLIETRTGHVTPADVTAVAQANDGTSSPDGHRFHAANPALINPGQRFTLTTGDSSPTPDAADPLASASAPVPPTATTPPAAPADTPPAAADVAPPGPVPSSPSSPRTEVTQVPGPTAAVSTPSSLPAPHPPPNPAGQAPATIDTAATSNATGPDIVDSPDSAGVPLARLVGWAGSAAAAAGVLALARRLQRRHPRRRRRPTEQLRDIDLVVRTTDNLTTTQWAATTLRALAHQLGRDHREIGDIACVHAGDRGLELLWNTPQPDPPDTWTTTDGGWTWHHARHHDPGPTGTVAAPCPTLVTIGRLDNGDDVLVNLETARTLHLTGTNATDVARGFIIELATSPYMDVTQILLCGIGLDGIDQ